MRTLSSRDSILLGSLSLLLLAAVPAPRMFTGLIEYVESKGNEDFAAERAAYVHENLQFIVLGVDRTVLGVSTSGRVLIGVRVDSKEATGIRWLSPSYGVLDLGVWTRQQRLVLLATPSGLGSSSCAPATLSAPPDKRSSIDKQGTPIYRSEALRQFEGLPVFCASVRDVFLARE